MTADPSLRKLPLDALHRRLGARMAPFAGYDMPLQFAGVIAESLHVRAKAGLFDVSHMGQAALSGAGAARALERVTPADIETLPAERTRYALLLGEDGGIFDDCMITRLPGRDERLLLVVNASRKAADFALLSAACPQQSLQPMDRALLALQGPLAEPVLEKLLPGVRELGFLDWRAFDWNGAALFVSRSGYTGEDGFEISLPLRVSEAFATQLLADEAVAPVGLAARDALRLEAGLPLYGQDLDETIDPVTAGLAWTISKRRRAEGGFPGSGRIAQALREGAAQRRVGLAPQGKLPVRHGAEIFTQGRRVGTVTSGGYSPTLARPIAMGFVDSACVTPGARLTTKVRDAEVELVVEALPFVPHRYRR